MILTTKKKFGGPNLMIDPSPSLIRPWKLVYIFIRKIVYQYIYLDLISNIVVIHEI